MLRNEPKHAFWVQLGGLGVFVAKKIQGDFMARTCALIVPVQPILLHVSGSNETLPNALKNFETDKNRSLGSDWVDQVRSLRKIPMRLHATNLCINCTNSTHFTPSSL